MSPTREKFPLSSKKVVKKSVVGTVFWVALTVVLYRMVFFYSLVYSQIIGDWSGLLYVGVLGLLLFLLSSTYLYQLWYYRFYFYDLTADFVVIKKGPITPREITIPYERIQDVYVDQDLLDRLFGLYDVHLSSATITSGMSAHIDGLEKRAAEGLRDLLLEKIHSKISIQKQHIATTQPQAAS